MTVNIVIDVLLLFAISLLSFSGFLLDGILPHCHGGGGIVKEFLGMGRHAWADIHMISGVVIVVLLLLHLVLHWSAIDGFFRNQVPNSALRWTLYVIFLVAMLICTIPWLFAL